MEQQNWLIYETKETGQDPSIKYRTMLENPDMCPRWRKFSRYFTSTERQGDISSYLGNVPQNNDDRGDYFLPNDNIIKMVNAALYLRRPLLVAGNPGIGKSTIIYSVARQLKLGPVLRWGINSKSTRQEGLYQYDAIGRLQAWQLKQMENSKKSTRRARSDSQVNDSENIQDDIGEYLTLGPMGTALLKHTHPRALLIDEVDKGNPDLANDLLDLLEEGYFYIPELQRLKKKYSKIKIPTIDGGTANILDGEVRCYHFPFVILTSNNEREFSKAFRRRCLHLTVTEPEGEELKQYFTNIIEKHLPKLNQKKEIERIISHFIDLRKKGDRTTDQLLQAIFLLTRDFSISPEKSENDLLDLLLTSLS
jgi:MoxR-like ATPase